MERVVSVNGPDEGNPGGPARRYDPDPTAPLDWPGPSEDEVETGDLGQADTQARFTLPGTWGTCLYLGPGGERCSRPALASGFCGRHQAGAGKENPSALASSVLKRKRLLGAIIGILWILWPLLSNLFREFSRWIHPH